MRWQDIGGFFKKQSRSRTLWYGGGSTIFAFLLMISMLTGSEITTSGDLFSEDCTIVDGLKYCDIYTNITLTFWQVCFNTTEFTPLYFDNEPMSYDVFVPARGKGNWRPLKVGDCIKRKNKWFTGPNKFKISIVLKPWQTIKYGVAFGNIDIDPFIYSDNIKFIKETKYEKLCVEKFKEVKEKVEFACEADCQDCDLREITETRYAITAFNDSCKVSVENVNGTFCNSSYEGMYTVRECEPAKCDSVCSKIIVYNESVECVMNGLVKKEEEIINDDYYFCGLDTNGIICDENKDVEGGQGDSNGDGICQPGETCIRK